MKFPQRIVNEYLKVLSQDIDLNGVLLFGSYAYGTPNKNSDVDLVIISNDFANKSFDDRLDWLTLKRDGVADNIAMDVIGYTPFEFRNIEKKSAIMAMAKRNGKWIYRA